MKATFKSTIQETEENNQDN